MEKIIDNIQIVEGNIDYGDAIADFALRLSEDPFRSKEKWLRIITQKGTLALIAMDGTKVIGKMQARVLDTVGWIESTRVDPQYRKKGIAKVLVSRAIDWLIEQGVSYLRASVDSDNLSGRLILERYKFSGHFLAVNPSTVITENDISAENAGHYSQVLDKELFETYKEPVESNFSGNIMIDGKYVSFTQETFDKLVDERRIYSNGDQYGILVLSHHNLPEEVQGFVISNSKEGYVRAGLAMRAFAAQESANFAIIHAPAKRIAVEGLIQTQFGWNSPHTLIIYQRDLLNNISNDF